jgi:hypothetical protein
MSQGPTHCICGAPLPPQPRTGRRRRWCSDACRRRHERNVGPYPATEVPRVTADELRGLLGPSAADPAEAATRCILLARSCAAAFSTVATKAPPALALRCDRAANGIARVIRREFKVRR